MIQKIINSIADFPDSIQNGTIKVCLLHPQTKISEAGWAQNVDLNTVLDPNNSEKNLGICLSGAEYPGAPILACIDIDGDKNKEFSHDTIMATKKWFFILITSKLDELKVKYMAIKSSSGGYHIYLYCLHQSLAHESNYGLIYPETIKSNNMDLQMFYDAHLRELAPVLKEPVGRGVIELWDNKRYMVAPGSDIYDEDKFIGTVELLPNGVQTFAEIGILEQPLNEIIRNIFLENGFTEEDYSKYNRTYTSGDLSMGGDLSQNAINIITDLVLDAYPNIPGEKHRCTLALGGFFYQKKISLDSVVQLGRNIVDKAPSTLFKNNQLFIDTLTHDIRLNDESRETTGLRTFEEILSNQYKPYRLGKQLHLLTNPLTHTFWPDGKNAKKYHEISISYSGKYMTDTLMIETANKDGSIVGNPQYVNRVSHCIDSFKYIDDISEKEPIYGWDRHIQIQFSTIDSEYCSPIYDNVKHMLSAYNELKGVNTDRTKYLIETLYTEFDDLNLIETKEGSTRAGIWYSRHEKKLKKFIKTQNGIQEVPCTQPSKGYLQMALQLLKQIHDTYPWEEGKFGLIIKVGLTMPYTYVLKNIFHKIHPSMILHAESGVLKTSVGELITYINGNFSEFEEDYIIGGGELNSEYRFGRAMDMTSFPLVVNESEQLFYSVRLRELIKDSVTGKKIREPSGNNPRAYYSRRATIYTMNNIPEEINDPAFLRRFITISFGQNEIATEEVIKNLSFLNTDGIINNRFKELSIIGDYVFWILNENIDWFSNSVENIQDNIINSMEKYANMDLSFLKENVEEYTYHDRTDQDNNKLSMILKLLRHPFLQKYRNGALIQSSGDKAIVKNLIETSSQYSYIHLTKNDDVIIDIGFKNEFNRFYKDSGQTLILSNLPYYLNQLDLDLGEIKSATTRVIGYKKPIRGVLMSLDDFCRIVTNKKEVS